GVAVSLDGTKPFNSVNTRSGLREGNAAPAPHRNALVGMSNPSGLPRNSYPANPDTSTTFAASLLAMTSNNPSALPVPLPTSFFAVGSFTMPRTASAAGFWRYSDHRFTFAPT